MSEAGMTVWVFRMAMSQNNALPLLVFLRCGLQGRQVNTELFLTAQLSQQDGFAKVVQWCMWLGLGRLLSNWIMACSSNNLPET
jgi:hypothetical protein